MFDALKVVVFNMSVRLICVLLIGVTSILTLSSCKKKSSGGDYGLKKSETLRVRVIGEPPTLDWHKSSDTTSSFVITNLMEGLVQFSYTGGDVTLSPALATSWEPSEKAKVWTFKIREGVKWSDGEVFEPKHIVDGWERLLNPATASQYAYYLYGIKNAKAYNEGSLKDFSKVGVELKGSTLVVTLEKPMQFPFLLTHSSTFPVRTDIVNKFGDQWTEPENIVTLGAYNLIKWEHDKALVATANPSFFDRAAKTKNLIFYVIQETQTAINLFDAGKIDVIRTLPPQDIPALKRRKEYVDYPILNTYFYGFNTSRAPVDNPLVRKAIIHAIDRSQIVKMMQGGQKPLSGWIPYGMFGYDAKAGLAFDPVLAKKLLKEAGYSDSNPLPKIQLSFNTLDAHKKIAENVQAQLKENLGISLEIKNEEWKVYLETLKVNPTHMYRMGWVADYPDPNNFFEIMLSYGTNNRTKWKNKDYDKLIEDAVAIIDDKPKRLEMYAKAHKILVTDEAPVFPIYTAVGQNLIGDRVVSFPTNVMYEFRLKNTSLQ
jgi:oligopeptide transport system substrate-binding protein